MKIQLTERTHHFAAFAIIVDLNSYGVMVAADQTGIVAQDARDNLSGAIRSIEKHGGEVVAFMGDALLAFMDDADELALACFGIAKDLNDVCEYISRAQRERPDDWSHMPGGPSLKISIEYGRIGVSTIASRFVGKQLLFAGEPINYAVRIAQYGVGNRCLLGPAAAEMVRGTYPLDGPFTVAGKNGEGPHTCYRFDMGDVWKEGRSPSDPDGHWD